MLFHMKLLNIGLLFLLLIHASLAKPSKDTEVGRLGSSSSSNLDTQNDKKNDDFPEEDTDMLMEPNDFAPISILRSQERQYHEQPVAQATQLPAQTPFRPIVNPRYVARSDYPVPIQNPQDSHSQAAQNYYPPFFREAPPLGHSRPYFPLPDSPLVPKYAEARPDGGNLGPGLAAHHRVAGFDHSILGSGDFGVIRGGTFYPEDEMPYHPEDSIDFVQKYTYPEEQFAQFRDFADINTPVDGAFSHFVVVYQAKNSTKPNKHPHPKNIFEQLELLDKEKAAEENKLKKAKQPSKSKTKLAKTKVQQKKYRKKEIRDVKEVHALQDEEPLLALS